MSHAGCVNRCDFDETGNCLASARIRPMSEEETADFNELFALRDAWALKEYFFYRRYVCDWRKVIDLMIEQRRPDLLLDVWLSTMDTMTEADERILEEQLFEVGSTDQMIAFIMPVIYNRHYAKPNIVRLGTKLINMNKRKFKKLVKDLGDKLSEDELNQIMTGVTL